MHKLTLLPVNESITTSPGGLLLPALLEKKLNILMSCGGNGICSTCHVRVRDGMDQLSPMGAKERRTLSLVDGSDASSRLACQTHVQGDGVVLELPKGMYIEKVEDLLELLGERAPENILHPIRGTVLIPKGKIITRTLLEQSRTLDSEVQQMKDGLLGKTSGPIVPPRTQVVPYSVTSRGLPPKSGVVEPSLAQSNRPTNHSHTSTDLATPPPRKPTSTILRTALPPTATLPPGMTTEIPNIAEFVAPVAKPKPPSREVPAAPPRIEKPSSRASGPVTRQPRDVSVSMATASDLSNSSLVSENPIRKSRPDIGQRVGKCILMECIGKGGSGKVFRALHTTLNIPVAVKFLHRNTTGRNDYLARFLSEAQLLAKLNHPNIVRILDFEDNPALPYVVMEFVEGFSLQDLINQSGQIRLDRALGFLLHTVAGLDAALQVGIIHRDVKPANILVSREGAIKLVDLGLALQLQDEGSSELSRDGSERRSGNAEGTVAYMAPEMSMNPETSDHRADIYALGVTFFQMVTGRLPFNGTNQFEMMAAHAVDIPPQAHELALDLTSEVSQVIDRMLAKSPAERYGDYASLAEDLRGLRETRHALVTA